MFIKKKFLFLGYILLNFPVRLLFIVIFFLTWERIFQFFFPIFIHVQLISANNFGLIDIPNKRFHRTSIIGWSWSDKYFGKELKIWVRTFLFISIISSGFYFLFPAEDLFAGQVLEAYEELVFEARTIPLWHPPIIFPNENLWLEV